MESHLEKVQVIFNALISRSFNWNFQIDLKSRTSTETLTNVLIFTEAWFVKIGKRDLWETKFKKHPLEKLRDV